MYFISLPLLLFLFLFFSEALIQINIYVCCRDIVCNREIWLVTRERACARIPPFLVAHIVHCLLDSLQKLEFYWSSNVERNVTLHGVVFPNLSDKLPSLVSEKFWLFVAVLLQSTLLQYYCTVHCDSRYYIGSWTPEWLTSLWIPVFKFLSQTNALFIKI
jgi:hypothetical protein